MTQRRAGKPPKDVPQALKDQLAQQKKAGNEPIWKNLKKPKRGASKKS